LTCNGNPGFFSLSSPGILSLPYVKKATKRYWQGFLQGFCHVRGPAASLKFAVKYRFLCSAQKFGRIR
jgi:hypothetical protein